MLDICTSVCHDLRMKFYNNKSYCIVFGNCRKRDIDPMQLDSNVINWVDSVKYLGVNIVDGKKLSFEIQASIEIEQI